MSSYILHISITFCSITFLPKKILQSYTCPQTCWGILSQSEMNGMCQPSQISAGDCRLSFLTSAFTHNSPLSPTYPMIPPVGGRWGSMNLCLQLWNEFKTSPEWFSVSPSRSYIVYVCVFERMCGFWLSRSPGEGKENTVTASFPKLSSHKWRIKASARVKTHLGLQRQQSLLKIIFLSYSHLAFTCHVFVSLFKSHLLWHSRFKLSC